MSPAQATAYGASVVAVEPHGLDAIDERERHGRPRDLFFLWFGANAETASFAVGILTVALYGTSLAGAALGIVAGNVLAYLIVGLLSRAGPRYGVPQMVASRLVFGRDGNLLPGGARVSRRRRVVRDLERVRRAGARRARAPRAIPSR